MTLITEVTTTYEVVETGTGYGIRVNGTFLTDKHGVVRTFATRSSARKTVTRLRRPAGDRHR